MTITNIKKDSLHLTDQQLERLQLRLQAILNRLRLNGRVERHAGGFKLANLRLMDLVYHTYAYDNESNSNWQIIEIKSRPYAKNIYLSEPSPIKRARYLQWHHWALLDNAINRLLDQSRLEATFRSAFGNLRSGNTWDKIDPFRYHIYK